VRSALQDCERWDNEGSGDQSDWFSVTDHEWISDQVHDDGQSEEAWNTPLGVEDIPEDLESDVGSKRERYELFYFFIFNLSNANLQSTPYVEQ
jgi:hypothetical protein